jgi:hypothetical protein
LHIALTLRLTLTIFISKGNRLMTGRQMFVAQYRTTMKSVRHFAFGPPQLVSWRYHYRSFIYGDGLRKLMKYNQNCCNSFLEYRCFIGQGDILASHSSGPGLSPGLASETCGGESGGGAGLLRALRFPLPIFIPPNSPSSQSPRTGTIGHSVANEASGPSVDSTPHYANLIFLKGPFRGPLFLRYNVLAHLTPICIN